MKLHACNSSTPKSEAGQTELRSEVLSLITMTVRMVVVRCCGISPRQITVKSSIACLGSILSTRG